MTGRRPSVSDIGVTTALPSLPPGSFDYAHAVLPDGRLALLRTEIDVHTIRREWRTGIEQTWTPPPAGLSETPARILMFDGLNVTEAFDVPVGSCQLFSRFRDGRWVFANARANDDDLNGRILAADGAPISAMHLGDGIAHLLPALDGTLWLGYFDEGVCSRVSFLGRKPLGWSGIANVSDSGTLMFEANSDEQAYVDDCYAMSLVGEDVWACTYSGFPITRIAQGKVTSWTNAIAGASALAVDGDLVLLFGGYEDDNSRLALVRLREDDAVLIGEVDLAGMSRGNVWTAQGYGDTLHITRADIWLRIRVRDFALYLEEQSR